MSVEGPALANDDDAVKGNGEEPVKAYQQGWTLRRRVRAARRSRRCCSGWPARRRRSPRRTGRTSTRCCSRPVRCGCRPRN
ncbi:hypothetical protein V2I01_09635 [Micromonospora sp. BRA006-A]|nr:hypothetical protein [Micromonospora sp. BRA006-A]